MAALGHSVGSGVEHTPRLSDFVSFRGKRLNKLFQEGAMFAHSEAFYVFKDKVVRIQFADDPHEISHQTIARVIENALADQGKALARSPTDDGSDWTLDSAPLANLVPTQFGHRLRNHGTIWKVEFMNGTVNRVDFDRSRNLETSLLKPQRHPARSREEINDDRPFVVHENSFRNECCGRKNKQPKAEESTPFSVVIWRVGVGKWSDARTDPGGRTMKGGLTTEWLEASLPVLETATTIPLKPMSLPILYIKPGCPWCVDVVDYLSQKAIEVETVVVSGNREAMEKMKELSGQTKAPTMNWHGEVLADFGVDELIPFLKKKGVV